MESTFRAKPSDRVSLGDYDLDAITIVLGANETELDFRLELGEGLSIFWALPASRNGRLRLAHVDGAAYDLPEPVLISDPWCCDLPPMAWDGALGQLGNGRTLVACRIEATAQPATYRCELVTRRGDSEELVTRLTWRADDPWHGADAATRAKLLDQLIARAAATSEIDIGVMAFIQEQGGRLFDESFLDGSEYAAIHDLLSAARRANIAEVRAALERCCTPAPVPARVRATLKAAAIAAGHRGRLTPPAFSPDGARFVAYDSRGLLAIHERRGNELVVAARVQVDPPRVSSRGAVGGVAWSPAGDMIALAEPTGVRLRDACDLSERGFSRRAGDSTLAFGGAGAWLASLHPHGVDMFMVPVLLPRHGVFAASADALAVDPAGDIVVVVDGGATEETAMGIVTGREPASVVVLRVSDNHTTTLDPGGPVRGVVYDQWRRHVIVNCFGGEVSMWTLEGALVRRCRPYGVDVKAIALTERWLVMIPNRPVGQATLDLWSVDAGEQVASAPIPGGLAPDWVVASPDGDMLLTRELPVGGTFGIRTWTLG